MSAEPIPINALIPFYPNVLRNLTAEAWFKCANMNEVNAHLNQAFVGQS